MKNFAKGQSLVELLLIIGISAILLPALLTGLVSSRGGKAQQNQRIQAATLLKEATEAVRSVRESGWDNISTNGTYYPAIDPVSHAWKIILGTEPRPDGFNRQIAISNTCRNGGAIINCPSGIVDPSTKKVDVTVSWSTPFSSSITSTLFLTRYDGNASYTETTQTTFSAGIKTGTSVRASNPPLVADDGEVVLGAGGNGNWCAPTLQSSKIDLHGGVADGVWAREGEAYITTGVNNSGLPFTKIAISDTQPPIATQIGSSTSLNFKGNHIFVDSHYAYIATDTNSKEIEIIDMDIGPPYNTEAGYFNAPGNGSAHGVVISGNYGYMTSTSGNKLYNLNKIGGNLPIDSDGVALSDTGNTLVVVGDYAYVPIEDTRYQLDIIYLSNSTNLARVGRIHVDGGDGVDVAVSSDGNRAYLVTAQSAGQKELFIIDTTSKSNPQLVTNGVWDTSPMSPRAVNLVPGNLAILVGWGGQQYQVINVGTTPPTRCDTFPAQSYNINDIATVKETTDGDVYSYLVTNDGSGEFKIIQGGPGGTFTSSGTFESQTFNPGYSTANNRFTANFNQPPGTTIQFQISNSNLVGSPPACPTPGGYTFVGQDGTSNTRFPLTPTPGATSFGAAFPLGNYLNYNNPGQCFRYKAYLETTIDTNTPVLYDFTINYSP